MPCYPRYTTLAASLKLETSGISGRFRGLWSTVFGYQKDFDALWPPVHDSSGVAKTHDFGHFWPFSPGYQSVSGFKYHVSASIGQACFKENTCGKPLLQGNGHQLVSVNVGLGQFLEVLLEGQFSNLILFCLLHYMMVLKNKTILSLATIFAVWLIRFFCNNLEKM